MTERGHTYDGQEKSGSPDETSNRDPVTGLIAAAKGGNTSEVLSLLHKANNKTDDTEPTRESLKGLALRHAAEVGHAQLVSELLKLGVGPETRETLLWQAARSGHAGVTKVLLRYQRVLPIWPYLYKKGKWITGFLDAVAFGHLETVRVMLDESLSANLRYQCAECKSCPHSRCGSCTSETAICLAARHGQGDIVELLLARGAKARAERKQCETALHHAAARGDEQMVRALLRAGWDPNRTDAENQTPILKAAQHGHKAIFDILLQNGGEVGNNEAKCLATLIYTRSSAGLGMILHHLPPATFARFFSQGLWVSHRHHGPLLRAVDTGDTAVTRCILDYNRKHDILPPMDYINGFHEASCSRNEALMGLLVEYCPWTDKRTRDEHVYDAVKEKAALGHIDAVLMLLEWHDEFGRCQPLLDSPLLDTALVTAVYFNQTATAKVLIEQAGASVHSCFPKDRTCLRAKGRGFYDCVGDAPLHIAARNGSEEICKILLKHGAYVESRGTERSSVLHVAAARASSVTILNLLLEHGADLESQDYDRKTPIHSAKGVDNIAYLHKAGANLNHRDWRGKTALYWAAVEGDIDKYQLLIELGADDSICDKDGKSAPQCYEVKLKEIERRKNCRCYGGMMKGRGCWCPR